MQYHAKGGLFFSKSLEFLSSVGISKVHICQTEIEKSESHESKWVHIKNNPFNNIANNLNSLG